MPYQQTEWPIPGPCRSINVLRRLFLDENSDLCVLASWREILFLAPWREIPALPRYSRWASIRSTYNFSTPALLCSPSRALYNSVKLPDLAASSNGCHAEGFLANSDRYRFLNSCHFAGSWPNQRRRSALGAASLHQFAMCSASFFIPRGQRRSTRNRVPSSFETGS